MDEESRPLTARSETTRCKHNTGAEHVRGSGSAALSLLQLIALVSFLAGGITLIALSADRHGDGYGEVQMDWYTTSLGEKIHGFKMSPGYWLGGAMLFMWFMYTVDLLALYPNWYMWCIKKINPKYTAKDIGLSDDTSGERRYQLDSGRTTRRYLRVAPTWGILAMVLHLSVGAIQIPYLLCSTVLTILCLIILMNVLTASNAVHHFMEGRKGDVRDILAKDNVQLFAQAATVGANTVYSGLALFFSMLALLADWHFNRDDVGTLVTSRIDTGVILFAVVLCTYWLFAVSAANHGLVSLQSYMLQPISLVISLPGYLTQYVFNGAFIEEATTTGCDLALYGVVSYLAFKDIIDSRVTP